MQVVNTIENDQAVKPPLIVFGKGGAQMMEGIGAGTYVHYHRMDAAGAALPELFYNFIGGEPVGILEAFGPKDLPAAAAFYIVCDFYFYTRFCGNFKESLHYGVFAGAGVAEYP